MSGEALSKALLCWLASIPAAAWLCDLGDPFPSLGSADWSKCFRILV